MTTRYMAVLFIFIHRMPFLAPTLDNADLLFALMITLGFCPIVITPVIYVHHIAVANQHLASDSLYANLPNSDIRGRNAGCS